MLVQHVFFFSVKNLRLDGQDETQINLLRELIDGLVGSVQNCGIKEYVNILHIEAEAFVNSKSTTRRKPPLFTLEKKYF